MPRTLGTRYSFGMVIACVALAAQPVPAAEVGPVSDLEDVLFTCSVEALGEALRKGADANWAHPESGESALHYALGCESGMEGAQYALVRTLVDAGAVVSASGLNGESVLERALLFGSEPTIALLLESGADANSLTTAGGSMLALARIVGNQSAERALQRYGADLLSSDQAAIEQWGGLADFSRSLDAWMDHNRDAPGEEYEVAFISNLRLYLGDEVDIANELNEFERDPTAYLQDIQCCGLGPSSGLPSAQDSRSDCRSSCHDDYSDYVKGCGSGWSGVVCRVVCGRQRRDCLDRWDRPVEGGGES